MIMQKDFDAKPEIRALPKAVQRKLDSFIFKEIPKVPFFKPDGKPKKEWKMFYGDTWGAAWDAAWDAAWAWKRSLWKLLNQARRWKVLWLRFVARGWRILIRKLPRPQARMRQN